MNIIRGRWVHAWQDERGESWLKIDGYMSTAVPLGSLPVEVVKLAAEDLDRAVSRVFDTGQRDKASEIRRVLGLQT